MSDSILVAIIVVVGWVISVCFHEFAHALVAYIGGDKTIKSKGYLTFNPFLYTDIRFSVILPTIFILLGGIGLPGAAVRVRDDLLRNRYWSSLVSFAGPFATFLWIVGMVAVIYSGILPEVWALAFCWLLNLEIVVLILNLLPIPGLDGFGVIEPFFSKKMREKVQPFYKHGFTFLLLLLWVVPGPNKMLWIVSGVIMELAGIPLLLVDKGQELYQKGSLPVAGTVLALAAIVYLVNQKNNWFDAGLKLMEAGDFHGCIALMNKALEKKPDARAYRLIALSYYEIARKRKSETGPERANYLQEALQAADKAVALDADTPENLLAKGLIYQEIGTDKEKALEVFDQVLKLNKTNEYALINKCRLLGDLQGIDQLLSTADEGLKLIPDSGELLYYKGTALLLRGQVPEALSYFDKSVTKGISADAILHTCMELAAQLSEADLSSLPSTEFFAKAQLDARTDFYVHCVKNYEEAMKLISEALAKEPENPRYIFVKSMVLFYIGRNEESLACAEQLIEMKYELRSNYYNKACCLVKLKRQNEAMNSIASAVKMDPAAITDARQDADLSALWELAEFKDLLKKHEAKV